MRQTSSQRFSAHSPQRSRRASRPDFLVAVSGEACLFDLGYSLVDEVHLPLFEAHFGELHPRALVLETLRELFLRSRLRGTGRFRLLSAALSRLSRERAFGPVPPLLRRSAEALDAWLAIATETSGATLAKAVANRGGLGRDLEAVLAWSKSLDRKLHALTLVHPRPCATMALAGLSRSAELVAVTALPARLVAGSWRSALTGRAFAKIWDDKGSSRLSALASHIGCARSVDPGERRSPPRFADGRILIVGDSLSDLALSRALGAAFFPLLRGREDEGWERLSTQVLPQLIAGRLPTNQGLLAAFLSSFRA